MEGAHIVIIYIIHFKWATTQVGPRAPIFLNPILINIIIMHTDMHYNTRVSACLGTTGMYYVYKCRGRSDVRDI